MELKILEEKDNALFGRKEVKAIMDSEVSPSREDTLKLLANKFKVPEENIKIKGIHGKFGSNTFTIESNIYSSKEEKDKLEIKKKKEKEAENKLEEASKINEQPAEEKTEEITQEKTEAQEIPVEQKEDVKTESSIDDKPIEATNKTDSNNTKIDEAPSDSGENK